MSLRAWLAARELPTVPVPIPTDAAAYAAAERAVEDAARALLVEQSRGSVDTEAERARLAQAERDLAAQPVRVVKVRALPGDVWEELVAAHPPTEAEQARGDEWHVPTFRPALLAGSVLPDEGEEPLTPQEWTDAIAAGHVTVGEANRLYEEAVLLNARSPRVSTGKG